VKSRQSNPLAFLLAQVGAHAAMRFAQRIAPLGLLPPHSGILFALDESAGMSQQQLATLLGVHPSRLVALVDDLEALGLAERQRSAEDRRSHALQLTEEGRKVVAEIARLSNKHQDDLCSALDQRERLVLGQLLRRIADQQGLRPGVHPGYGFLNKREK
jgi:DNA-binding MarR family transcriptional regulator